MDKKRNELLSLLNEVSLETGAFFSCENFRSKYVKVINSIDKKRPKIGNDFTIERSRFYAKTNLRFMRRFKGSVPKYMNDTISERVVTFKGIPPLLLYHSTAFENSSHNGSIANACVTTKLGKYFSMVTCPLSRTRLIIGTIFLYTEGKNNSSTLRNIDYVIDNLRLIYGSPMYSLGFYLMLSDEFRQRPPFEPRLLFLNSSDIEVLYVRNDIQVNQHFVRFIKSFFKQGIKRSLTKGLKYLTYKSVCKLRLDNSEKSFQNQINYCRFFKDPLYRGKNPFN